MPKALSRLLPSSHLSEPCPQRGSKAVAEPLLAPLTFDLLPLTREGKEGRRVPPAFLPLPGEPPKVATSAKITPIP